MTTQDNIQSLINQISPQTNSDADTLKMLFYYADLSGKFDSDDEWAELCKFVTDFDKENDIARVYTDRYIAERSGDDVDGLAEAIRAHMLDNYILAAVAAYTLGGVPFAQENFIPVNACNKHSYQGLKDEFSVMRFLHWAGADIDAWDGNGNTALHYFSQINPSPHSNPRAVRWLLEHDADVHAKNNRGDTPIMFMSGVNIWTKELHQTFILLNDAGAKWWEVASDGKSALDNMMEQDLAMPIGPRSELVRTMRLIRP